MAIKHIIVLFVKTPRKFITAIRYIIIIIIRYIIIIIIYYCKRYIFQFVWHVNECEYVR
jgi:hypothetical protein